MKNQVKLNSLPKPMYELRLFITGTAPRSLKAVENIKLICEEYLSGRYKLEIIDVYQHPQFTEQSQIIAAPTLVKSLPLPLKKLVGDMSDTNKVLSGLGLQPNI